jgi:hypothetical protein
VKYLYNENYKIPIKHIEEDTKNEKTSRALGLNLILLLAMLYEHFMFI